MNAKKKYYRFYCNILVLLVLFISMTLSAVNIYACSMFKYTTDGKTFVGNNEDYSGSDTWMWIEVGSSSEYGAVYFGYSDYFPQGGMNEKGLVFDGFAMPFLEVKEKDGKKAFDWSVINQIMKTSSSVLEVKSILEQYDLSELSRAQLMYVDKTGNSIIVEGDRIIESDDKYRIATNFYQSLIEKSEYPKACSRYSTAYSMLHSVNNFSIEFGFSVLNAIHQDFTNENGQGVKTQYSNLYDLDRGKIYLSHSSNFEEFIELSIHKLLEKGDHRVELKSLF